MKDFFLTAYDPSDLPGGSVDPMGFERGYLYLANKILPGMTNVADCPRYFGMICVGSLLSGVGLDASPKDQRKKRGETILRLERLWALANVLSEKGAGENALSGLRGVTYAIRHKEDLIEKRKATTDCNYKLLIRQVPYGALGIYGAVAEYCGALHRSTYELTPALGLPLGEAFQKETEMPTAIRKAVQEDGVVSLDVLTRWGNQAYLRGKLGTNESRYIADMIKCDPIRNKFASLLNRYKYKNGENEQERLKRIGEVIKNDTTQNDLSESIQAILQYERCYQIIMLGFERLLHLSRSAPSGALKLSSLGRDTAFKMVQGNLPSAAKKMRAIINNAHSEHFKKGIEYLDDVLKLLEDASNGSESAVRLAEILTERHTDVQRGKFDHGRRKMPWMEIQNRQLSLTMTRVGGMGIEVVSPDKIATHPYRLNAADRWIAAAGSI